MYILQYIYTYIVLYICNIYSRVRTMSRDTQYMEGGMYFCEIFPRKSQLYSPLLAPISISNRVDFSISSISNNSTVI